jgi:hypothetical protein
MTQGIAAIPTPSEIPVDQWINRDRQVSEEEKP